MTTPLSTPVRHAKLGISSTKSLPIANEYKKLLAEQFQRLWTKHQQDLDLIDDIRGYVKTRLSIERDYTSALNKLSKQHSNYIGKKFALLNQCDPPSASPSFHRNDLAAAATSNNTNPTGNTQDAANVANQNDLTSDSRLQKRLANNGLDEPDKACSLYKVWSEHINRLETTSKNRADQFEQLIMIVDKLKDIRSHKASIGKKCLDTHLKRIHEDILVSIVDVEKTRKLYYEDESQAKKARENEEKIKKKRSGLLTKFTDLQAKKEKTSAQREANDIQSTQARNDYIMALAAGNAHLQHYYQKDLNDFIHLIDDGVLDHCKIFMATLSECDINSLKDALTHAQYWSKMINLTGSQRTNTIFLECEQSLCLRSFTDLNFEPCNNDPIQHISLEHNADYALQHEIDKWFTWFKKECRNLSQLMHQLEVCQHAFAEGKKNIELNGQIIEDLEPKIIDLKQQIRKSEAAKLKAQARLKVIKEGGMQIEEWSIVESEIRADMARAQEELESRRLKELANQEEQNEEVSAGKLDGRNKQATSYVMDSQVGAEQIHLQVSKDSDDSEAGDSVNHLASVSRSNSNLVQKQQNALSGYSALTDPSLVWQDDYSSAWGSTQGNQNIVVTDAFGATSAVSKSPSGTKLDETEQNRTYDLLSTSKIQSNSGQPNQTTSMTVQSSSPLSAIVDGAPSSTSPYPGMVGEAYKSDYECDYDRNGHHFRSAASSAEPFNQTTQQQRHQQQLDAFGVPMEEKGEQRTAPGQQSDRFDERFEDTVAAGEMLDKDVVALYSFDKTNVDDLAFNENDILRVIEVSDENWVKARNEATGEEGYIPTSYIRLRDELGDASEGVGRFHGADDANRKHDRFEDTEGGAGAMGESIDSERPGAWSARDSSGPQDDIGDDMQTQETCYCRAVYDYEPESNTYEEDGLPHLALVQGEVMRIIDQGEDDGWWLVEKEESGVRGHVPSMLVEEVEPYNTDCNEAMDEDDGDASEYSDDSQLHQGSIKAMPDFEAPVLELKNSQEEDPSVETVVLAEAGDQQKPDLVPEESRVSQIQEDIQSKQPPPASSSLVPTSFIIIEPTPEVESKRVVDSIENIDCNNNDDDHFEKTDPNSTSSNQEPTGANDRRVIYTTSSTTTLPNDHSYSVVNENFVLDRPTRVPDVNQVEKSSPAVTDGANDTTSQQLNASANMGDLQATKSHDENYEPLSEVDSVEMPAPPAVVIDSCADIKREMSSSSENEGADNDDNGSDMGDERGSFEDSNDSSPLPTYVQREIKHTGNVDISPLLRHRAEEFSKQIIAEAIMMAPGSELGPSTSAGAESP